MTLQWLIIGAAELSLRANKIVENFWENVFVYLYMLMPKSGFLQNLMS